MERNKHRCSNSLGGCGAYHARVPVRQHDLIKARTVRGFRFTESLHKGFIETHSHEQATVNVLLEGQYEEKLGASFHRCETNSVLMRPAGLQHSDLIGESGAHLLVLEFDPYQTDAIRDYSKALDRVAHLTDLRLIPLFRKIQWELQSTDDSSKLALEGLALEFLAMILRTDQRRPADTPRWLSRGQELIHDRFKEEGIKIKEIARETGVHPVHFCRVFKLHFGLTPGRYLRKIRMDWAARELKRCSTSIAEIAIEAGFADQSHFGRTFKAHFGCTPAEWRAYDCA